MMLVSQEQKEKLLQKTEITFDEAVMVLKAQETAKFEARLLSDERPREINLNRVEHRSRPRVCKGCGRKGHDRGANHCVAKNVNCFNCDDIGHFVKYCTKPLRQKRVRGDNRIDQKQNEGSSK